jgi:hypothetical protein
VCCHGPNNEALKENEDYKNDLENRGNSDEEVEFEC